GQVFLDGNQIFYHMITNPENSQLKGSMRHFYEKLLTPVINTYNELGVNAVYAPVNDIVAENKKVSGNGAATLGDSRILTGNFILSFPSKEMSKVLRVPDEKFRDKIAQSLDERVGSFQSLTGSIPETDVVIDAFTKHFQSDLGVELIQVEMTPELKGKLNQLNQLYKTSEWMYENSNKSQNLRAVKIMGGVFVCESMIKTNGGLIKGIFVLDNNKITDANLTGDISVDPIDGLSILERKLVGQEVGSEGLRSELTGLLSQLDMPGVTVDELMTLITQAAQSHKENQ
ncbi:MAG: hypothetical protein OEY49_18385, partial [Candidatus Heimdallarchaeota archaeon]|nr:hypothetical protein [Candidatus Heimdallarchaeota archaeon]